MLVVSSLFHRIKRPNEIFVRLFAFAQDQETLRDLFSTSMPLSGLTLPEHSATSILFSTSRESAWKQKGAQASTEHSATAGRLQIPF